MLVENLPQLFRRVAIAGVGSGIEGIDLGGSLLERVVSEGEPDLVLLAMSASPFSAVMTVVAGCDEGSIEEGVAQIEEGIS